MFLSGKCSSNYKEAPIHRLKKRHRVISSVRERLSRRDLRLERRSHRISHCSSPQ